jgi:hypothetical protein
MPKTPFNFVLPHFSPYEFYVKAPQSELLYYPHTYSFCVVSLIAQAQGAAASAAAVTEAEMNVGGSSSSTNNNNNTNSNSNTGPMSSLSPRHMKSSSMAPLPLYRGQPSTTTPSLRSPPQAPALSTSTSTTSYRNGGSHPYQHQHYSSVASTSSLSMGGGVASASPSSVTLSSIANGHNGQGVPRPERLVLRTQTNRIYKLVYDPLRQCHEAKVEIKERGIWECVRMDDGGKSRVGREGTGGVVIASWKCV